MTENMQPRELVHQIPYDAHDHFVPVLPGYILQIYQCGGVRKRSRKLFCFALVLVAVFLLLVGTTSAALTSSITGPLAGGTVVTITGTGFTNATAVMFGDTAGTDLHVVDSGTITIKSPLGSGTVHVKVVNPYYESTTSGADEFTYTGV